MVNWFKKKKNSETEIKNGPDFSEIDSNEKAIDLYNKGELVKIHLMPIEFGGDDNPMNTLYAPEFAKEFKGRFDGMIEQMLIDGKQLSYSTSPKYKGNSFIPSQLIITVDGDVNFEETINIW